MPQPLPSGATARRASVTPLDEAACQAPASALALSPPAAASACAPSLVMASATGFPLPARGNPCDGFGRVSRERPLTGVMRANRPVSDTAQPEPPELTDSLE